MGAAASHAKTAVDAATTRQVTRVGKKGGWVGSLLKWAVPVLLLFFLARWKKKPLEPAAGDVRKKPSAGLKSGSAGRVKHQREARKAASAAAGGQKRGEQIPRPGRRLSDHAGEKDALEKLRREHAQMRRREAESHLARAVSHQEQLQQKLQQEQQQRRRRQQPPPQQQQPEEALEATDLDGLARADQHVRGQQNSASGAHAPTTHHVSRHLSVHIQRCCQALTAAGQAQKGASLREHLLLHNARCETELPAATLRQAAASKLDVHPLHPPRAIDRFQLFVKQTQSKRSRKRQIVRSPIEPEPDPEPVAQTAHSPRAKAAADNWDWRQRYATMTPEERDAAELAEFQVTLAQYHGRQAEQERFRKLKARFRELEAAAEARDRERDDDSSRNRRASAGHINPRSPTRSPTADSTIIDSREVSASPRRRRQSAAAVLLSPSPSARTRLRTNNSGAPDECGLVHHAVQLHQTQVDLSPVSERTEETEVSTASGDPATSEHWTHGTTRLSSLGSVLTQRIEEEENEE